MKRKIVTVAVAAWTLCAHAGSTAPAPMVEGPVMGGYVYPWWEPMWASIYAAVAWFPWG